MNREELSLKTARILAENKTSRKSHLKLTTQLTSLQKQVLNARSPVRAAMECLRRGDMKGARSQLSRAWKPQCESDGSPDKTSTTKPDTHMQGHAAIAIAEYMNDSAHKGKRTKQVIKDFLLTLRIMAGKTVYDFVAQNLNFADESTARKWARDELTQTFVTGVHRVNFEIVAGLYKDIMEDKGLKGPIPCMMAEDETSINAVLRWDPRTDTVVGTCGELCKAKCGTIKECREKKCEDPHSCVYNTDALVLVVGDNSTSYERLGDYVKTSRVARLLRAIIVNPLHPDLPAIPLVIIGTCSTFTYKDYLIPQWRDIDKLFDEVFWDIGLRRIGHSSDGDSRRRKAYVHHSLSTDGIRFMLTANGFIYSGKFITTVAGNPLVVLNMDEDYLHAMKKLWNSANHSSRDLFLGPIKQVRLSMLLTWLQKVPKSAHGCNKTDSDRKGFKAMRVPSLIRMCTEKAIANLEHVAAHGWDDMGPQPYLAGCIRLLKIIRMYGSLFLSNISNRERVRRAGYVTTYLRLWREWVRATPGKALKENYLTREASQDAILSCHFVVLLMKLYRDFYPTMQTIWKKLGSECCEVYFSSLGGFSVNKRTYSVLDALQTTRSQLVTMKALARTHLKQHYRNTRPKPIWDDIVGAETNPLDRPSDAEMKELWESGSQEAYSHATDDCMKPPGPQRTIPDWWWNPHLSDNRDRAWQDEDDQLDVGDEDDDDEDEDDDENADDDNDGGAGVAAAFVQSFCASADENHKIRQLIDCPGNIRRHKAQMLVEFAGSGTTLSADRALRMQQTHEERRAVFNVSTDNWIMALGSDIALRFASAKATEPDIVWYGKVLSMRKLGGRDGKTWITYQDPVLLQNDRTKLGELFVTCFFYKRYGLREPPVYKFSEHDYEPYHVKSVICPVKFTYDKKLYTLDHQCYDIIKTQMGGKTTWAPPKPKKKPS